MSAIWERAMDIVDDDDVGLHMGAAFGATALRTTSMIMQSSPTLYEALEMGVKYSALIADVLTTEIGESDDHIYLEFTPKHEWLVEPARVVKDCLNITLVSAFYNDYLKSICLSETMFSLAMVMSYSACGIFLRQEKLWSN